MFDNQSDVYVYDLKQDKVLRSPLLADSTRLETFPTFFKRRRRNLLLCGKWPGSTFGYRQRSLQPVSHRLDPKLGKLGAKTDTIVSGIPGRSVSHPRVSPDGKRLLYTVSDFGTFPIWHREADLQMIDLGSGKN